MPETKFDNKYGWQYATMHMVFDLKQQDLRHKARLVVGGNVVDSAEYTTFSSTIKYVPVIIILFIAVKNVFLLMAGDIVN